MTTGLDPEVRRDAWQLIEGVRNRGVTIILVTPFPATTLVGTLTGYALVFGFLAARNFRWE